MKHPHFPHNFSQQWAESRLVKWFPSQFDLSQFLLSKRDQSHFPIFQRLQFFLFQLMMMYMCIVYLLKVDAEPISTTTLIERTSNEEKEHGFEKCLLKTIRSRSPAATPPPEKYDLNYSMSKVILSGLKFPLRGGTDALYISTTHTHLFHADFGSSVCRPVFANLVLAHSEAS